MNDDTEDEFIRNWSGRAFDDAQLAQIAEIERHLIRYAMEGWRPMSIAPPYSTMLICACEEGIVLMTLSVRGEWRTSLGSPHKPPRAWMPCPEPPKPNGKGT